MWQRADISFVLEAGLSEGDVATMRIDTPAGVLLVMDEPEQDIAGEVLRVRRVHSNGPADGRMTANSIGAANLQAIGQAFLEVFGYEQLILEGAIRTSGKRKGARPRPIRFTRHPEPANEPGGG